MEDTLDKILEDLTLWQLKELVLALRPQGDSSGVSGRTRADLLTSLNAIPDKQKLTLAAQREETIAPHKHVLPLFLKGAWHYERLKESITKAYPSIINKIDSSFELLLYTLSPELCIFDDDNERIFLKFNHLVEAVKWESVSKDEKIRRRFRRRHPVVVCFRSSLKLLTIEFMGYTQISIDEEPLRYSTIAKEICDKLLSEASLDTLPCDLKPSIRALLKDPLSGVSDCKLSLSDFEGKMTFSSDNEEQNLAEYLAKYLAHVNISITVEQAREVLDWGETGDVALLWKRLQILTRVSFQEAIPEILFVWRGVEASSNMIDEVLKRLTEKPSNIGQVSIDNVRDFLFKLGPAGVVRPAALSKKFAIPQDDALRLLLELKGLGIYQFCFKVKGDFENEFMNPWKWSQADLPRLADKDGVEIDPLDPHNVEVAFRKVEIP